MSKNGKKVGYGSPPDEHKFKKGQSGNIKGRPKRLSFAETILNELNRKINIQDETGEMNSISAQRILIRTMIKKACSDPDYARLLINILSHDSMMHS